MLHKSAITYLLIGFRKLKLFLSTLKIILILSISVKNNIRMSCGTQTVRRGVFIDTLAVTNIHSRKATCSYFLIFIVTLFCMIVLHI